MSPWSYAFRRGLARALPGWVDEGLITPEQADDLRARSGIEDEASADAATLAVYVFGALLVFGGLASFVAWNWDALPGAVKLAGGVALMVGVELLGFRLGWQRRSWPSLGHALILLGVLLFGANLALVAQIFHIEPSGRGLLAWSAAAAGFGFALRSAPAAVVSALALFAYLGAETGELPGGLLLHHLAWIGALGAAAGLRSLGLAVVAVIGGGGLVAIASAHPGGADLDASAAWSVPLAFMVAGLGLASFTRSSWLGRVAGAGVVFFAFVAGFSWASEGLSEALGGDRLLSVLVAVGPPLTVGALALARAPEDEERPMSVLVMGAAFLLLLGAHAGEVALWLSAHLVLVGKVASDLGRSLTELERGPFWSAVALGVGTIGARFLEIQTGLLAKAVAFIVAGLAVIAAGYLFERRRKEVRHV